MLNFKSRTWRQLDDEQKPVNQIGAINIFRENGYDNLKQAIRLLANDIKKLWDMIQ